ncbi:hypothetical protein Tco_1453584 [Tanacetum coccineum]
MTMTLDVHMASGDKAEKALASAKQAAATSQLKAKEATKRYEKAKEVSEKDNKRATERYKKVWTVPAAAIPVVTDHVSTAATADVEHEMEVPEVHGPEVQVLKCMNRF